MYSSTRLWKVIRLVLLFMVSTGAAHAETAAEKALWASLADGSHAAIIRHALAPGFGDPDAFLLDDCTTQRNLNGVGQDQARRIGDLFRANGISDAQVMTSQWCRCRETAELMDLGPVTDLPALNSFFQDYSREEAQDSALREWLRMRETGVPLVLVTHQVNIRALTGLGASSGEIVVFRMSNDGNVEIAGRIETLSE